MKRRIDFLRNLPSAGSCYVAPVLECSCTTRTLRFSAPYAPCTCLPEVGSARSLILYTIWFLTLLYQSAWSQQASHQAGTALAQQRVREAASKGFLSESSAADKIPGYTNNPGEMRQESSVAKERVREQLAGTHMRIDANTDPMFVNANRAVDNPDVTLRQQTITSVDEKDYTEQTCIETRDDEFEVIKTSSLDPYYKHFEVYQFYNHCPNHQGWGKSIAQGCITWRRPELLHTKHNPGADYEEIHGMEWKTDAHPDFEFLFQSGKCRLKREVPKEEGRASRMITVDFYKKEETRTDWSISRIDEHREGRSRLKRPEDFGVESFKKVQVFVCSYQSPGNTCKRLRDLGGLELQSTCIERLGGVCVKWQKRYKVPNPGTAKTRVIDMTAGHKEAFNADGSQNDTTYVDNTESAEAIAKLTALKDVGESLPKINTGDPQALTVFTGEDRRCPRQAGMNRCPGGRSKKNVDDQILERKFNEGKCIYIGTYKERWEKNIGTMIGQKRIVTTYCCYDSVLAKVLHQGAIAQGLKPLGEPKSPNCGPLTLGQLQAMDWNRIDLGPFVAEMMSKVNLTAGHVAHKSAATVQSHLGNQMEAVRQARIRGGGNP